MKDRIKIVTEDELNKLEIWHKVETALSEKLKIPSLRAGNIIIRDENNWRINEKKIEYCWLVNISLSSVGWCWLFSIKFNESKFREINNPEKLIQGIFTIDKKGQINDFFKENRSADFIDKIKVQKTYDLFGVNKGITLDRIGYEFLTFTPNAVVKMKINNPNSKNWKNWGSIVWELGTELSNKSQSIKFQEIFKYERNQDTLSS